MTERKLTETIRLKPSDVPLGIMGESKLDELTQLDAFNGLTPEFRESKAFRDTLTNHARLIQYSDGDIIIREGDWGNSAFFVVSGKVRVAIEPLGRIAAGVAQDDNEPNRGFLGKLKSWVLPSKNPEYRDVDRYESSLTMDIPDLPREARIYLQDVPAIIENYRTIELTAGNHFGEIGALGRTPRSATCFARGEVELLEVRWQGLRDLMRKDTGFRQQIDDSFRRNAMQSFLISSPLFAHLEDDPLALLEVIQGAELSTYGDYDRVATYRELADEGARTNLANEPVIVAEGDYCNGIIMIRSGLARVTRKHHDGHLTVNYLCPGQVFGYDEVVANYGAGVHPAPLRHTLRAIGFISVVTIPTALVEKHLLEGRVEQVQGAQSPTAPVSAGPSPESASADELRKSRVSSDMVEFLVQERFINGVETMLIDLDRCTRCDDCVKACASTHDNNPRFVRQGPTHQQMMVANACMHCLDPVCLIECPTGAISRHLDEGVVQINDLTCIGCGTCAKNCSYDAIRMVEVRAADGSFIRDRNTQAPITKATKCDLCVDQYGGPACQRACPHDALVRMNMQDLDKFSEWRRR